MTEIAKSTGERNRARKRERGRGKYAVRREDRKGKKMYPTDASEAAELWNRRRAEMRDSRGGVDGEGKSGVI